MIEIRHLDDVLPHAVERPDFMVKRDEKQLAMEVNRGLPRSLRSVAFKIADGADVLVATMDLLKRNATSGTRWSTLMDELNGPRWST